MATKKSGHSSSKGHQQRCGPTKDLLQKHRHFPNFENLPEDNDLDLRYYRESPSGVYVQSHSWCFLGEVVNDEFAQLSALRNRVIVKDRTGKEDIPVAFYPESGSFDFTTLRRGRTLCVMFAQRHMFLDLTVGLRVEELDTVQVIKCSLSDLLALSKRYSQCSECCWGCGKTSSGDSCGATASLKKCSACKVAHYCSKECQVKDWKETHRRFCKAIPDFLSLAESIGSGK